MSTSDYQSAYMKAYYQRNKKTLNENRRVWAETNKEKIARQRREYRLANYDRVREQEKKSREKNIEKHRVDSRERMRRRRAECPEKYSYQSRKSHHKNKYGMTLQDREQLLKNQGNVCAVCGVGYSGAREWHIDHNHSTGYVRGLLCSHCNLMLGHSKDSPRILRAAAEYIERTESEYYPFMVRY